MRKAKKGTRKAARRTTRKTARKSVARRHRCTMRTKAGKQCKRFTSGSGKFCSVHKK